MIQLKRMILGGVLTVATLVFFLGAMVGLGSLVSFGGAATTNVVANVIVSSVCYISLSNSVVLWTLGPSQNSITTSNAITDTDQGGNAPANILISGGTGNALNAQTGTGNWIGTTAGDTNTIAISNTVYSNAGATLYGAGTAVTSSLALTGYTIAAPTQGSPTQATTIYLGMAVPPGQHADTYTTNIVIENSC